MYADIRGVPHGLVFSKAIESKSEACHQQHLSGINHKHVMIWFIPLFAALAGFTAAQFISCDGNRYPDPNDCE